MSFPFERAQTRLGITSSAPFASSGLERHASDLALLQELLVEADVAHGALELEREGVDEEVRGGEQRERGCRWKHAEEHLRAALGEKTMAELGAALAEVTGVSV